jgi:dimeric dUTPase (all-alpha-NTP-PPase superfamily)
MGYLKLEGWGLKMDLKKLFETQKVLRDRISYNESDRFEKLVLALLVELGECANEWRGFKFWSKDQEPRTKVKQIDQYGSKWMPIYKNPLLEEYVDGLHFILELGIEKGITYSTYRTKVKALSITDQFNVLFRKICDFEVHQTSENYSWILDLFIGLGEMLGFTWEEIEQAYFAKNAINHERQDNGY